MVLNNEQIIHYSLLISALKKKTHKCDGYHGDGYHGDGYHGDGYPGDGYPGDGYQVMM